MIRSVTIYCSSSQKIDPAYLAAGRELGLALAKRGWTLVYGGNRVGMMGVLSDAVREGGGKVVGITPQLFIDLKVHDTLADELVVSSNMRDRKAMMEQRGDAFVTLPGGLGTFEEIFEIICGKQLGYHNKPIVLLNVAGYYDPLLAMIDHGVSQHFIKEKAKKLFHVSRTVVDAMKYLASYKPQTLGDPVLSHTMPSAAE
jgi:uncharacterized protein (TIGR00730 family)